MEFTIDSEEPFVQPQYSPITDLRYQLMLRQAELAALTRSINEIDRELMAIQTDPYDGYVDTERGRVWVGFADQREKIGRLGRMRAQRREEIYDLKELITIIEDHILVAEKAELAARFANRRRREEVGNWRNKKL